MSDLIFPPSARVSRQSYRMVSNTAGSRSIFTGAVRTVSRTGDRWRYSLSSANTSHREAYSTRAALMALIGAARGMANRIYVIDPEYVPRGSFPATELLANSDFAGGTTGWSTSSANIVLSVADRILRSKRASVSSDETIRAAVATTVSGAVYIARVVAYAGRGAMDYRLRLGTSAGGTELAADGADWIAAGFRSLVATASGTSTHFSLVDGVSSRSIGHYMDFPFISLSRCALVNGASQTGLSLNIDALPVSSNGLLLPGDRVQIGTQLSQVSTSLDSDSSGAGVLQCASPWRTSPADNAPIVISRPMGRFVMTSNEGGWEDNPGVFSNFELEFEEALDA